MGMITTKEGRKRIAQMMNGTFAAGGESVRVVLFSNNFTPDLETELADLTLCTFTGYADAETYWGAATGPTFVGDDAVIRMTGNPITWDCSALPQAIRGWALVGIPNDLVYFVEKYDVPHDLEVGSRHTLYLDIGVGACS